jgi:aminoglycoside/choline kinase family phosphotransferase
MEDLGDTLLQEAIQKDPSSKMKLLGSAVQLLASLHGSTYPVPRSLVVSTRTFDTEKYSTELLFTFDHLHAQFLGLSPLSPPEETKVISFCDYISKIQPLVFSHRDYHCRNLLAKNTSLYLIDFQDARMGPPHYDLASILYDAYCPLSEAERTKLIQLYQTALSTHPIAKDIDWSRFDTDLTAVAFQRVVKAAGSFASFYNRNKKPTHLPYLEPALTMAMYLREKLKPMDMLEFPIQQWLKKMNEKNLKERLW